MPLHFNSITADEEVESLLDPILDLVMDAPEATIFSEDKRTVHLTGFMRDTASGDRIGKFVVTLYKESPEEQFGLADVDITLDSEEPVYLKFLKKLPGSSEANEYYDVEAQPDEQHLQIETVNRQATVNGEIVGMTLPVCASAFPFRLSVYEDMDAFNATLGFTKKPDGDLKEKVGGLAETFAAPGSLSFDPDFEGEAFSWLVGTVKSFRDVTVALGGRELAFTVAQVKTALGLLPVAMSREVFDLDLLAPGKTVSMYADVKADFDVQK